MFSEAYTCANCAASYYSIQVQLLVEKNKNLHFKLALELAANVQPIKVDPCVIDDVR